MKSARNQLILLGFICQGLTWDDYVLPLANILLWVFCLTYLRGRLRFRVGIECLLMLGGSAAALLLARAFGHDSHFFIGHGLTAIQAARLLRPLDRREKLFSILMACFQLGVACTFLFDLRFIPVFFGMVILLPKALVEFEADRFTTQVAAAKTVLSAGTLGAIFAIAVLFFLVFPRGYFGGRLPSLRGGSSDSTSLLDTVVDPTRSVSGQSRRVLLQIEGQKMNYLRCYSLNDFDGVRWSAAPSHEVSWIAPAQPEVIARSLSRKVYVKQVSYLGNVLPTDGWVVGLNGRFFRNPQRNAQDAIQCQAVQNTGNNIYEYSIDPLHEPEPLAPDLRQRVTKLPPQSQQLRTWLDALTGGETNELRIARRLEAFLKTNFKYRIGAPELNRLDPVDDFVFNQKEGHCERFASTLALLLRMKDIPSRVVIGYLPRRRGGADGWYTVRFNDAHAWTEAYFKDAGWVALDATPAATTVDSGWPLQDWWDTLDLAWNLHVVNYDGASQRSLLGVSYQGVGQVINWIKENAALAGALAAVTMLGAIWRDRRSNKKTADDPARARQQAQIVAGHYYAQMLRALAKQGFHRPAQETPLEFLDKLAPRALPWFADAQAITRTFCGTRYGNQKLTPDSQAEIEQALKRIKAGPVR